MFSLRYWYKRLTAIRVYDFNQLKAEIRNIDSRPWYKSKTIYPVNPIEINESIRIPPNIHFVFGKPLIIVKGNTLVLGNPDQINT